MLHVIVSDLHPDANTAGFPRFHDVEAALFEAVEYANVNNADTFIFAGDLITNDPSIDLVVRCASMLDRAFGILKTAKAYKIPGNHDVFEDGLGTTVLDATYEGTYFPRPGFCAINGIGFLPFTPASHRYDPVEALKEFGERSTIAARRVDLIVGHLNLEGINVGSEYNDFPRGREVFFPIEEAKEMFPNAVLVNGHIHRRQVHRGVHVVGSIVPLTRGEVTNEPGFLAVRT